MVARNSAPHSGAVAWARGLVARIEEPMSKVQQLNKIVMESDEAKDMQLLYNLLIERLTAYEEKHISEWKKNAGAIGEAKLKQCLMAKYESATLDEISAATGGDRDWFLVRVNFDPDLVRLLREVRYFLLLGVDIPVEALKIYQRSDVLRAQTENLEIISITYNHIQNTLLPVEFPLIENRFKGVDEALKAGFEILNWNSHKIDDYIGELMATVKDLSNVLTTIKRNVENTCEVLSHWEKNSMFERKEGKTYSVE